MAIHPRAGQVAQQRDLVNIPKLISAYYLNEPDVVVHLTLSLTSRIFWL